MHGNKFVGQKMRNFSIFLAVYFFELFKKNDFLNSKDSIGKISSISIRNNVNVIGKSIFGPVKIIFFRSL